MMSDKKRALIGMVILMLIGIVPVSILELYYRFLDNKSVAAYVSKKYLDVDGPSASSINQNNVSEITLDPIIIAERPIVKNKMPKSTSKKKWVCTPPRQLEQGYGEVRECEWE